MSTLQMQAIDPSETFELSILFEAGVATYQYCYDTLYAIYENACKHLDCLNIPTEFGKLAPQSPSSENLCMIDLLALVNTLSTHNLLTNK